MARLDASVTLTGSKLSHILRGNPEFIEQLSLCLDRDMRLIHNWKHLASTLEVEVDVIKRLEQYGDFSPTFRLFDFLESWKPDLTIKELKETMLEIGRNDLLNLLTTEDSVLKELGCSFQGSLNVPDPTRAMISTSRRRERRGSPPKQVAEVQEQSSHFGSLPDRTNLVGRSNICGNIISALSSNKAVEIVAPPGYGKTSVVIEVAHRMMEVKKAIVYVNPRDVTCVEDLESKIIEALGFGPGENTMTEIFRRLSSLQKNSVLLIIENIDNLLHLEDQVSNDKCYQDLKSTNYNTKVCGKYMKDDFLTFFKDLGQRPNIQLLLTSRIIYDFNVYFPVELIDLEPLNEKDSASMFEKCDDGLEEDLIKDLVRVCGGIPLVICIVISILKRENPHEAARRLSTTSPSCLARELDADFLANEDRIYNCLQVCFDRLSHENQKILVIFSTFPCSFTREQFQTVFELSVEGDLQMCLNCLKQSSLLRFDRRRNFSLDPFIKGFLSLKPGHTEAKSTFICHYSTLVVTLYKTFLSKDCKSAIVQYILEKNNIREAMAWCGDDHPELDQTLREKCIKAFNKAAVFLAKVMNKQEFQSLFYKLAHRCPFLRSACLTNIGMKVMLSCTCTPHICQRALNQAKETLTQANQIQSTAKEVSDATRAQCLSKLGFCCVCEGSVSKGFEYIDIEIAKG